MQHDVKFRCRLGHVAHEPLHSSHACFWLLFSLLLIGLLLIGWGEGRADIDASAAAHFR